MSKDSDNNQNVLICLETFDDTTDNIIIDSPRSLEALSACGLTIEQLARKPESFFTSKYGQKQGQLRAKRYEHRRVSYIEEARECRQALLSMTETNDVPSDSSSHRVSSTSNEFNASPRKHRPVTAHSPRREPNVPRSASTRRPPSYNNTPALNHGKSLDAVEMERQRVANLVRRQERVMEARICKEMHDELIQTQMMKSREDQERWRQQEKLRREEDNKARQVLVHQTWQMTKDREREIKEAKRADPKDVSQDILIRSKRLLEQQSSAGVQRQLRAHDVMVTKELLAVRKDQEIKEDDKRIAAQIEERKREQRRKLRLAQEQRDYATQQAAAFLEQVQAEKEIVLQQREDHRMRANEGVADSRRQYSEDMSQKLQRRQDNAAMLKEKVMKEWQERRDREAERERERADKIEQRREQMRRESDLAKKNKNKNSLSRAVVYQRADQQHQHKEQQLQLKLEDSNRRTMEAKQRLQAQADEARLNRLLMEEEQREHIARVEKMHEYRRKKVQEKLQYEDERVQWLAEEKQRLRRALVTGDKTDLESKPAPVKPNDDDDKSTTKDDKQKPAKISDEEVPPHIKDAAQKVSHKLGIPLSQAMTIAKQLILANNSDNIHSNPTADQRQNKSNSSFSQSQPISRNRPQTASAATINRLSRPSHNHTTNNTHNRPGFSGLPYSNPKPENTRANGGNNNDNKASNNKYRRQNVDLLAEFTMADNMKTFIGQNTHTTAHNQSSRRDGKGYENDEEYKGVHEGDVMFSASLQRTPPKQQPQQQRGRPQSAHHSRASQNNNTDVSPHAELQSLQHSHNTHLLQLLEHEHRNEVDRQRLKEKAPPGPAQERLEMVFAQERARAAAMLQKVQRDQQLTVASKMEELGLAE